ncbi:hypothetical protein [Flavobacterium sp. ENC]|uniref:hypothetical protein n=1 Tax=Flavobacterium sp. ENC TaxID=2897330 RepID=UPI001E46B0A8|nr:hypothetical protein [Flavobacterium sp. ENC]MCD0467706.1 hypothetical protein [Flavobacterium sp. ENC]
MKNNKVLIYDNQHGFSRFLTKVFGEVYDFEIFKKFDTTFDFDNLKNEYLLAFFVIYSEKNIFDLMKIYRKEVPLVVCTFNEQLLHQFESITDISVINTSKCKQELINDFQIFLYTYVEV